MALQSAYSVDCLSPRGSGPSDGDTAALLGIAGAVEGLHVLVSGPGSLELMCGLSCRGAHSVTILRPGLWIRPDTLDVAFLLDPSSIEVLEATIAHLRHALRPLGIVCLRLFPGVLPANIRAIDRLLSDRGFRGAYVTGSADGAVLSAALPCGILQ